MSIEFEIDGNEFWNYDEFYDQFEAITGVVIGGGNLDAFSDVLSGGFGLPTEQYTTVWNNHRTSIRRLGRNKFDTLVEIFSGFEHITVKYR